MSDSTFAQKLAKGIFICFSVLHLPVLGQGASKITTPYYESHPLDPHTDRPYLGNRRSAIQINVTIPEAGNFWGW